MNWRYATQSDLELLAELNRQLILDEGHHNPMSLPELHERMRDWLASDYRAVLFLRDDAVVAYALFRTDEWNRMHIRQFLVIAEARRQGIGRAAMRAFWQEVVPPNTPVILEVLTKNGAARAFYDACGFREYAITLIADPKPETAGASRKSHEPEIR